MAWRNYFFNTFGGRGITYSESLAHSSIFQGSLHSYLKAIFTRLSGRSGSIFTSMIGGIESLSRLYSLLVITMYSDCGYLFLQKCIQKVVDSSSPNVHSSEILDRSHVQLVVAAFDSDTDKQQQHGSLIDGS
nr:ubiquitin-like protein-NEDD8-like protein RUB3 [Ipomoea batatas]GMD63717.1 ubiquitin-like protein-NEDD8-like protein RUB3 [Ipomoea batatas]